MRVLVDPYNLRPISSLDFAEGGAPLFEEVAAAAKDDPNKDFVDDILTVKNAALDGLPSDRAQLSKLSQDWQVRSTMQQRVSALLSREWTIEAGGTRKADRMAADWLSEQIKSMAWDDVVDKMLFGVFYGYGVGELLYARDSRYVNLYGIRVRASSRFKFDGGLRLRLTSGSNPKGELMPERKFWVFTHGAETHDDPYGVGLAHYLYWPVTFKRQGIRAALKYLDRFAHPTPIGKYAPGTDRPEVRKLLQALEALTTSGAIVVPQGMEIEKFEASRNGGDAYGSFEARMDAAISKIVLSQTMTSDAHSAGMGSGQAEVHQDVAEWVVKRDADLIAQSFNAGQGLREGPVEWMTQWNFPGAKAPRFWYKFEEEEDQTAIAERDAKLFPTGLRRTQASVDETYGQGIYERTEPAAPPTTEEDAPAGDKTIGRQAAPVATDFAEAADDVVAQLTAQLAPVGDRAIAAWSEQLRDALAAAPDLASFAESLGALAPQLSIDDVAEVMRRASVVAHVRGIEDVRAEG